MINQPESTTIPEFRMTADFERDERWICAIRAALSDMLFSQTVEDCQDITDKEARQIADTIAVAFAESVREGGNDGQNSNRYHPRALQST